MRTALKLFRVKKGLTQDEMSVRLNYSRNQYQRIENGVNGVSLKFLVALCDAFGLSLDEAKELTKRDDSEKAESDCETR